jgi:hypothetical protein
MSKDNDLLVGAMRLKEETGKPFPRDIESDIFQRPLRAPQADYDGDTPSFEMPKPQLPRDIRLRRKFNNMSLKAKNEVRKLRKELKVATKYMATKMVGNMRKLHDKKGK